MALKNSYNLMESKSPERQQRLKRYKSTDEAVWERHPMINSLAVDLETVQYNFFVNFVAHRWPHKYSAMSRP